MANFHDIAGKVGRAAKATGEAAIGAAKEAGKAGKPMAKIGARQAIHMVKTNDPTGTMDIMREYGPQMSMVMITLAPLEGTIRHINAEHKNKIALGKLDREDIKDIYKTTYDSVKVWNSGLSQTTDPQTRATVKNPHTTKFSKEQNERLKNFRKTPIDKLSSSDLKKMVYSLDAAGMRAGILKFNQSFQGMSEKQLNALAEKFKDDKNALRIINQAKKVQVSKFSLKSVQKSIKGSIGYFRKMAYKVDAYQGISQANMFAHAVKTLAVLEYQKDRALLMMGRFLGKKGSRLTSRIGKHVYANLQEAALSGNKAAMEAVHQWDHARATAERAKRATKGAWDSAKHKATHNPVADTVNKKRIEAMEKAQSRVLKKLDAKGIQGKAKSKLVKRVNHLAEKPIRGLTAIGRNIYNSVNNTRVGHALINAGKHLYRGGSNLFAGMKNVGRFISNTIGAIGRGIGAVMTPIISAISGAIVTIIGVYIVIFLLAVVVCGVLYTFSSDETVTKKFDERYIQNEDEFMAQFTKEKEGYASITNKKGEMIRYGVNVPTKEVMTQEGIKSIGEYKNGITLNYWYYEGNATPVASNGVSSNEEDVLTAMAVIMSQEQEDHMNAALELIDAVYKSTHSYSKRESPLYPCTKGCAVTHYICNQWKGQAAADGTFGTPYWGTDMRFSPWLKETLIKPTETQECEVCRQNGLPYEDYAGCTPLTEKCFHGEAPTYEVGGPGGECSNAYAVYSCPGHEVDDGTDAEGNDKSHTEHCPRPLGCEGYYACGGHYHYVCPGHDTLTCFGHVDLSMDINVYSLNYVYTMGGHVSEESTKDPNTSESEEDANIEDNLESEDEPAEEPEA